MPVGTIRKGYEMPKEVLPKVCTINGTKNFETGNLQPCYSGMYILLSDTTGRQEPISYYCPVALSSAFRADWLWVRASAVRFGRS